MLWNANGQNIYVADEGLVDIDLSAEGHSRICLPNGLTPTRALFCSPDGANFVFLSIVEKARLYHLTRIDGRIHEVCVNREGRAIFDADVDCRRGLALVRFVGNELALIDIERDVIMRSFVLPPGADTPRLSPLGDTAAFGAKGGLWELSLSTGAMSNLAPSAPFAAQPAWSPNGREIVFTDWPGELWHVNVKTQASRRLLHFSSAPRVRREGITLDSMPTWSPDGRYVWFTLSTTDRTRVPTSELVRQVHDLDWSWHAPSERAGAIAEAVEDLHWQHWCVSGIIDFGDGKVCLDSDFVPRVSWCPVERETAATFRGTCDHSCVEPYSP